MTMMMSQFYKK